MDFPDPVLTANIYCRGCLDEIIHQVVTPFWQNLRQRDVEGHCYLWLVRYSKCGEHLKIRLHGPESRRSLLRHLLGEAVDTYMTAVGPPEQAAPSGGRPLAPPIDVEDRATADYPDRSILWTEYRRSHVSLGGQPFLDHDRYAALMTTCLARGCERVLDALKPDGKGSFSHRSRQNTLLKALLGGLTALGFPAEKRAAYLLFHRDWLIRFLLVDSQTKSDKEQEILADFERRIEKMETTVEQLGQVAARVWGEDAAEGGPGDADGAWGQALSDLLHYVTPLCADPDYHLDPFASDPVFSPLFKVFHGLANQLGLDMLNEGFTHHLLWSATTGSVLGPNAGQAGSSTS